ncbi:MAG: outer membrane lipoprotein-sorting protein [Fidelibacterota bacterium]
MNTGRGIAGVFLFVISQAGAQTGLDVARQMDEQEKPRDMKADLTMILTNARGNSRTSTIRSVSLNGTEKQMIWFLEPADDKGVAFLKIEHEEGPDEMRLWLPAFKKVRRISARQKGDAFMGSDLNYEDMTSRSLDENDYELLGSEEVEGVDCYVLEVIPRPETESIYSRHVVWVSKKDLVPLKEESYDRADRLLKRKTITYTPKKDYLLPKEIYVENVQKDHSTRLTFSNIEVDSGVGEELFHERNLKRMPTF